MQIGVFIWIACLKTSHTSPEVNRLFEDLLGNYNKLVRPIRNPSESITIRYKFKLLQILDVRERDQVMTTNGWLIHVRF